MAAGKNSVDDIQKVFAQRAEVMSDGAVRFSELSYTSFLESMAVMVK